MPPHPTHPTDGSLHLARRCPPERLARMVETIYGCKWSLTVYRLLASGVKRPGAMVRHVEGLTKKVLADCLRKNVEFGILERQQLRALPPHVEYALTPFGRRFTAVLDELERLQEELLRSEDPDG